MDKVSLILAIIGAINLGCLGIFNVDLIGMAFGGAGMVVSRVIYTVIGIAGLWCITMLFRDRKNSEDGSFIQ